MIAFDGNESFPLPAGALFAKLGDAGFLAACMPDTEVVRATPDEAVWKSRPKVSILTGTIDTTARVTERRADGVVRYSVEAMSGYNGATVEAILELIPSDDGGTRVRWSARITGYSGLLKLAPSSMVQPAAVKAAAEIWLGVRAKLAAEG